MQEVLFLCHQFAKTVPASVLHINFVEMPLK